MLRNVLDRGLGFAKEFDKEACFFERARVGFEGSVNPGKRDLETRVLAGPRPRTDFEVGQQKIEWARRVLTVEPSCGSDRVCERDAEPSARDQHPCDLPHSPSQVGDVLQAHERDREVDRSIAKG